MSVFSHPAFDDHEAVHFIHDTASGLAAIIALHSTARGPAAGGCRLWHYASSDAALNDVLRLSRGMSYKNAMADLPLGGGKAVIIGRPGQVKNAALFAAFGRAVESLGGRYVTAEDVGISVADMAMVAQHTRHVSGLPQDGIGGAGGDPSPKTARGVFFGIKAAVSARLGANTLQGLTVAVQGLGSVGYHLCQDLHAAGARLLVADINATAVARAVEQFGASAVPVDEILAAPAQVLAPCALGGILCAESIPQIQAQIVAGGANNQLLSDADGERLQQRDILYAPDYVINAGGIINVAAEYLGGSSDAQVMDQLQGIGERLSHIFATARREAKPTNVIADEMARRAIGRAPVGVAA